MKLQIFFPIWATPNQNFWLRQCFRIYEEMKATLQNDDSKRWEKNLKPKKSVICY